MSADEVKRHQITIGDISINATDKDNVVHISVSSCHDNVEVTRYLASLLNDSFNITFTPDGEFITAVSTESPLFGNGGEKYSFEALTRVLEEIKAAHPDNAFACKVAEHTSNIKAARDKKLLEENPLAVELTSLACEFVEKVSGPKARISEEAKGRLAVEMAERLNAKKHSRQ